jgi:hypothetical protein
LYNFKLVKQLIERYENSLKKKFWFTDLKNGFIVLTNYKDRELF